MKHENNKSDKKLLMQVTFFGYCAVVAIGVLRVLTDCQDCSKKRKGTES